MFIVEELMQRGLSAGQAEQAAALINAPTGRRVETDNLCIIRNRQHLVLSPLAPPPTKTLIDSDCSEMLHPVHLRLTTLPATPLTPADRPWQAGDRFSPLGMRGTKKLSDFLTDQKIPAHLKQQALVLTDAHNHVVWVVGHRIDTRYAINSNTQNMLRVEIIEE